MNGGVSMDKRKAKILWTLVLALEVLILAAMLLSDFGILSAKINPLSLKGLLYHAVAVILVVISIDNIKKLK